MNNITQFGLKNQQFMTVSLIAELTGKNKSHVFRDARMMIELVKKDDPKLDHNNFQILTDVRGYTSEIQLDKNLTMTLITGYSIELRYAVMKRWKELEEAQANTVLTVPHNLKEALELALHQIEVIEMKDREIQEKNYALAVAQPKVEFFNTVADRDTLLTATQVGLPMGMTANALNKQLMNLDVYDKRCASKVFSSWFVKQGLGKMRTTQTGHAQAMFTPKGEQWIFEKLRPSNAVEV